MRGGLAGTVIGGSADGLRLAVAPVDGVGEARGSVRGARIDGGNGEEDDLVNKPGGRAAEGNGGG